MTINREILASAISESYDVDGVRIVTDVAHKGDKPTIELLLGMAIEDVELRRRTVRAIFKVREELGVHAE